MKKIIVLSFVVFFLLMLTTVSSVSSETDEEVISNQQDIVEKLKLMLTTVSFADKDREFITNMAWQDIAAKLNKRGWSIKKVYSPPVEKTQIVEADVLVNNEIITIKEVRYFRYFRFLSKHMSKNYYKDGVATFSFCGGKWRLSKTAPLEDFLDKAPENYYQEIYWELYDLDPS